MKFLSLMLGFTVAVTAWFGEAGALPAAETVTESATDPAAKPDPAPSATAVAQMPLAGILQERGTRIPLGQVNIFILPQKLKATTDDQGRFSFPSVGEGPFEWVVNFPGYQKLQKNDVQIANITRARVLYLERLSYQQYESTTVGKADQRDDTRQTLKASEFLQLPGSGGDPIKAVQNLPGISRPPALQAQIVIQGSAPQDTTYTVDGHEVPLIYHFGGLSSVIFPEALERVDFLSAGYGPEYGRVLGGLIGVWTRAPDKKRFHGIGYVDVFNAGLLLESPVGAKGSVLIAGRQSYLGPVLKTVLAGNKSFNLTVAPEFGDLLGVYDTEFSPNDKFRLTAIGSRDKLEFLFNEPVGQDPSIRGNFSNRTSFFRFIPQYSHNFSEATIGRLSLGTGKDLVHFDVGDKFFDIDSAELTLRGEVEHHLNQNWVGQIGMDNDISYNHINLLLPNVFEQGGVYNPISTGDLQRIDVQSTDWNLGFYWRNEIKLRETPWTVLPSLRSEFYSSTHEPFFLPRLTVRYKWDDTLLFKAGTGLYAQPPQTQEVNSAYGNSDVKAERAWHLYAGVDKDWRYGGINGISLSGTLYYKKLSNLIINSSSLATRNGVSVPERYNNGGSGKAYGGTLLAKFSYLPFVGFVSYTLSQSLRTDANNPDYPFQYDQTHIITAVLSSELGSNWRFSSRFRYSTGNPTTSILSGTYDSDNDVYLPTRGRLYGERLEPFIQLDLRVDKRWIFATWILSAYLDIQNVTNRQNLESVRYSFDYSTSTKIAGLPILPTLGLKVEF